MIITQFKAMNSTIKLSGMDLSKQLEIKELIDQFEQKASRFIPANPLDALNQSPLHVPVYVEETLANLLEKSLQLTRLAHYYVNPFMGDTMKSIGYTDSFQPGATPIFKGKTNELFSEEPFELISKQWIIKKRDFTFDFGGFGKGYIVDEAIKRLAGETSAVVNAGGDLAVIGRQLVGIEHPMLTGKDMMRFYLTDHALATSGKNYRKWVVDGKKVHHIINGRSGATAENGVRQASVIAKTVMEAETISKLFCILPFEEAKAFIQKNFRKIAYFIYFDNHTISIGGDNTLYEELEVAE